MSLLDDWHQPKKGGGGGAAKPPSKTGGGGGGGKDSKSGGKGGKSSGSQPPSDDKTLDTSFDDDMKSGGAYGGSGGGGGGGTAAGAPADDEVPMFQTVKLEFKPSREQGQIVHVAVGNEIIVIGLENSAVVRWNLKTNALEEFVLSKKPAEEKVHRVFIDPAGNHSLVAMSNGSAYYINAKSNKPVLLTKVKGIVIESVAWDPALPATAASGTAASGTAASSASSAAAAAAAATAHVLVGTTRGHIYEILIEPEKDTHRDKTCKKVYDLSNDHDHKDGLVPISGLRIELFPPAGKDTMDVNKYFVMAATPTRHYQFIGGPTFELMFAKYAANPAFVELPGDLGYSELRFYSKNQSRPGSASETCAWMTGAGIYYGNLVFGSQDQPGDRVVDDGKLLAYPNYPPSGSAAAAAESKDASALPPLSLILTEFHFLLLNKKRLYAINQLSEEIVYEETFPEEYGVMKGLCPDPRHDTVWMWSNRAVFEVEVDSEDREVWRLYLNEGKYSKALEYCDTDEQKETVFNAQADYYFNQKMYESAAKTYALTQRSFEEVTLKFVNTAGNGNAAAGAGGAGSATAAGGSGTTDARNALKTYLMTKLERLQPAEITQQAMICTWLTEIFLDNINSLSVNAQPRIRSLGGAAGASLFADAGASPKTPLTGTTGTTAAAAAAAAGKAEKQADEDRSKEQAAVIDEFHDFLDNYADCLNRQTTFELISSHGRTEELLRYAKIIGDMEWVIGHHIQQRNYPKALSLLKNADNPSKIEDLYYKFAPVLMHHKPAETVDMLMGKPGLDATKLIPALMRYETARAAALLAESKRDPKEVARERKAAEEKEQRAAKEKERKAAEKEAAAAAAAERAAAAAAAAAASTPTAGGGKDKNDKKTGASVPAKTGVPASTATTKPNTDSDAKSAAARDAAAADKDSNSRDLFSALGGAGSSSSSSASSSLLDVNHAIRYLEHCVKIKNKDGAIHNYLVSLYAKETNEIPLLRFIVAHRNSPLYDYKYALRLCHQQNKKRACVYIYAAMRLFDDAVKLAVDLDIELAKKVVGQSEGVVDVADRKRLWLIIARKVIDTPPAPVTPAGGNTTLAAAAAAAANSGTSGAIKRAMAILKECELNIEDILPYFPNFTKIGEFKNEICNSLETYNKNIDELKQEMEEYTTAANLLRRDINDLRNRSGFVTASQKCDLCSQPVLTRQFYLFPCTHVFHVDCVVAEHKTYLDKHPRIRSAVLSGAHFDTGMGATATSTAMTAERDEFDARDKKSQGKPNTTSGTATAAAAVPAPAVMSDKELKMVERWASSECFFCGDLMIDSVTEPFISLPTEIDETKSWAIDF